MPQHERHIVQRPPVGLGRIAPRVYKGGAAAHRELLTLEAPIKRQWRADVKHVWMAQCLVWVGVKSDLIIVLRHGHIREVPLQQGLVPAENHSVVSFVRFGGDQHPAVDLARVFLAADDELVWLVVAIREFDTGRAFATQNGDEVFGQHFAIRRKGLLQRVHGLAVPVGAEQVGRESRGSECLHLHCFHYLVVHHHFVSECSTHDLRKPLRRLIRRFTHSVFPHGNPVVHWRAEVTLVEKSLHSLPRFSLLVLIDVLWCVIETALDMQIRAKLLQRTLGGGGNRGLL